MVNTTTPEPDYSLTIKSGEVTYTRSFLKPQSFPCDQIHCVLLSDDNILSFQVGHEVFSIPVQPEREEHQEVVAAFVEEIERSNKA